MSSCGCRRPSHIARAVRQETAKASIPPAAPRPAPGLGWEGREDAPTGRARTRAASMRPRRCRAAAIASADPGMRSAASATMSSSSWGEWRYSSTRLPGGQPCLRTSACRAAEQHQGLSAGGMGCRQAACHEVHLDGSRGTGRSDGTPAGPGAVPAGRTSACSGQTATPGAAGDTTAESQRSPAHCEQSQSTGQ